MPPKRNLFAKLPDEIILNICEGLPPKDARKLLSASKRLNGLAGDVPDAYLRWALQKDWMDKDFDFHCKALCANRWRSNTQILTIYYDVERHNPAIVLPRLTYVVARMFNLASLAINTVIDTPDSDGFFRIKVKNRSQTIDSRLMDYCVPNEWVENLLLEVSSSRAAKPSAFPYAELLDRYPVLQRLTLYFRSKDSEFDELMEAYLPTLPVKELIITYGPQAGGRKHEYKVWKVGTNESGKLKSVTSKSIRGDTYNDMSRRHALKDFKGKG